MWLYILIFIAVLLLYNSAKTRAQQQKYFTFCMVALTLFVGVADMLGGYDRYIYSELFDEAADTIYSGGNLFFTRIFLVYPREIGYWSWNFLVGHITSNRYIFILLTTFLMYFYFWRAIKRQTDNPMFALVIFMALTFFFSFTYIRQMLAVAIAWQAIPYIQKRNFKMYCLWMLLAFSFHNSALIFFPVYFLPLRKFDIKYVNAAIIICFILGLSGFSSALFDAYLSVDAERVNVENYTIELGFRWSYLIEALFFYYFIRKYYNMLGYDRNSLLGLNFSIIFCCILLLFIKSDNGGRLSWYFTIGLYSLMEKIFAGREKLAKPYFVVLVCFVLFLRILVEWGVLLSPYKTFFTSGIRDGDFIERKFEYDHNYDINKFYR